MKSLNKKYIYPYQVSTYFGNSSQLFVLVYTCILHGWRMLFKVECIISEVNFGLYSYGYLGKREWSRRIAGLSTPKLRIWMTVKGIAFSLEEIWKTVSVAMFCSGCMVTTNNHIPILFSWNSRCNNPAWFFIADYFEQDVRLSDLERTGTHIMHVSPVDNNIEHI